MKYKAYFSFDFYRGDETFVENNGNPVRMMMVDGGTNRMVNLDATDDISLVSEMKQAAEFKNIILYLSSTKNHQDMVAALDLMEIAGLRRDFAMSLTVERFNDKGKMLEGIELLEATATLKYTPRSALKNTMMITIVLTTPLIYQGKIQNHLVEADIKQI